MRTVALTGATSMLGVAFVKECIRNNIRVFCFVRPGSVHIGRIPNSELITVIECDLFDIAKFDRFNLITNRGCPIDVFFHFGWTCLMSSEHDSCDKQLENIKFTVDAVRLAKKLGCKKFVGAGTQVEYGIVSKSLNDSVPVDPITAYGVVRYAAGKLAKIECMQTGMEYNWVRILSIYGVYAREENMIKTFIYKCKNNIPMDLGPCTHIWDYLYEDDAGRAFFAIGKKGANGKIYCLGSGIGKPLKEYIEIVKDIILLILIINLVMGMYHITKNHIDICVRIYQN
jgi:nucleoside-diphosphate-sugar epimerase